jgi:hypothetical protein
MKNSHLPLASAITLVAGLALLVGLGRIHGEQESAAASPASALGPCGRAKDHRAFHAVALSALG